MRYDESWLPESLDQRIDRLESLDQIRQLAFRYASGVDSRNLDDLVELFVDDVRVGRDRRGRAALRDWFAQTFSRFGDSIHLVGNHVIDLDGPDTARGVVYCRDELEKGERWQVGMLQYWDVYVRRSGRWYFRERRVQRWYAVDAAETPWHGAGVPGDDRGLAIGQLPDVWPSWSRFWRERNEAPRPGRPRPGDASQRPPT
ncbi:nuclear transport factor 2 family protein [Frankia sp. CNm7]|uniref:Nuclear transport factor 2 family protein n=1 Tax=Frankia nepalensis TaxID=1836974 RepID=A0A937URV8_9ACTN|nr:nuclear transport factor 2 family protein [Frankia nepalensis]MBL7498676.1 nuclear transport factor 2 family protein [Frankia nepalensis]MBL7509158.1 nuclear transport factor 2 family protein [Frankia nepalensis]MBL7523065.1 nuclear transport factor 2 family protein [Frankia nepalensis]MBL7633239.1 nuclear transport factor 2 family protein [Frankia nepalensis]